MPFERPSLTDLIARIAADIESRLPGADARLRRNTLAVLARALAGAAHGLHGHLDWLSRQVIYDTADDELLQRWASIWGVYARPAAAATGPIELTGTNGAAIPAGTALQRSDGTEFVTDADATIDTGEAQATVTAVDPGADGNTPEAAALTLVNPIAGVDSEATVGTGGIAGGVDPEGADSLRGRLVARIQAPPHGGTAEDYERWALEVPGVTRAWVYPEYLGIGTVGIIIVDDNATPIIPETPVVQAVQAHIDENRPVTADAIVVAPVAVPLDITIADLEPDTASVRQAVEDELADFFRRDAIPGGTIYRSRIAEAISAAQGEISHTLTAPAADVIHAPGEIATLGAVTWS